jgi:tetratricopeptide (TPR) repeat protein
MKHLFMLLAAVGLLNTSVMAQAAQEECMTNLSIFSEYVKVKNFDAAYEPWKQVYENCPELNYATFSYGERILNHRIDKATGAAKEAEVKALLDLVAKTRTYFPDRATLASVLIDEAIIKSDNKMGTDLEVFQLLDRAVNEDGANFKNPKAIYLYFSVLVDLNAAGQKDLDEVFAAYDVVKEKIDEEFASLNKTAATLSDKQDAGTALTSREERMLQVAENNSKVFNQISESIDVKLGNLANCDNLIPLYQRNFAAKKGDIRWVKGAVSRMFAKECTDDPLFVKLVEAQNALDPSADAYFYLGMLKQKQGNNNGAVADFNKAVEMEGDAKKRSAIFYKVATTYEKSSKINARNYAQKAIAEDPSNGRAYLLIARLYANSADDCGKTTFEKRAIYWKAAEMAAKAGKVDLSIKNIANRTLESYNAKAPSKTDIFESGLAGQTISFDCWVGGSVRVPSI